MKKSHVRTAALVLLVAGLSAAMFSRPQCASAGEAGKKDIIDTAVAAGKVNTLAPTPSQSYVRRPAGRAALRVRPLFIWSWVSRRIQLPVTPKYSEESLVARGTDEGFVGVPRNDRHRLSVHLNCRYVARDKPL